MNKTIRYALLLAGMTSLPAMAHIGYGGRDFGSFDGTLGASQTISNQSINGNYGWIDGTDADWGDSHAVKAYRFTLTDDATVSIAFQAQSYTPAPTEANPNPTPVEGGLIPGFSLFAGLAHVAPFGADFDGTPGSIAIRDAIAGAGNTEGSFRALTDWAITNTANDPASQFTYIGHVYDGLGVDYGTGLIAGADGIADQYVSRTFSLVAGDYSIFVGGIDYANQDVLPTLPYGMSGTIAVVPEPEAYAMLLAGLGLMGAMVRRRTGRG